MRRRLKTGIAACCLLFCVFLLSGTAAKAQMMKNFWSGSCGDYLTWQLSDGVLTISGSGAMANWSPSDPRWGGHSAEIEQVDILPGVASIGCNAFYDCINLKTVAIPASVASIHEDAFSGCIGLESIQVSAENPWYTSYDGILFNRQYTELVQYPASSVASAYEIPASVVKIGKNAFAFAANLTSVTMPASVQIIRDNAFYGCTALNSIILSAGITSVPNSAFWACSSLQDVYYPGFRSQWGNVAVSGFGNESLQRARLHCIDELCILWQPSSVWVRDGIEVAFGVRAWGLNLRYQWQYSSDGGYTWADAGVCSQELRFAASFDQDGWRYRCVVMDSLGQALATDPVTLNLLGKQLDVTRLGLSAGDTVYIDGTPYTADAKGRVILYNENARIVQVYSWCKPEKDPYTWYPTGMRTWLLGAGSGKHFTVTYLEELENVLTYAGISLHTDGSSGMQVRTRISADFKAAMLSGTCSYKLIEYGTLAAWSEYMTGGSLSTEDAAAHRGFAYSLYAYRDQVYQKDDGALIFTNTLTFGDSRVNKELTIRPYIILTGKDGKQFTIYGAPIVRTPASVARSYQNTFKPGTAAANYVQSILQKAGIR